MITRLLITAVAPTAARSFSRWVYRLGGLGFIPLGLIDSSVIPMPGSMDVLTIVLAGRHPQLWLYYAVMATIGSVIGGFVTYRLARKGGKESLSRRFSAKTMKRVYAIFERWGFAAIAIPAVLPPPIPIVPFLLAAGAMQYSLMKFLLAMTLGRIVRYLILAYLAERYGQKMLPLLLHHAHPVLLAVVGLSVAIVLAYFFIRASKKKKGAKS
ncbi:MAG TPA: VTT domain-containing protein [Candidatus Acidoferrum sp.]|nr:VTT domain-containing protein [Candidatus Acidoferrum sp.]